MMSDEKRRLARAALACAALAVAAPVAAQDVDAMAKWTAYTVVRYKVVGEYSGLAPVLIAKG